MGNRERNKGKVGERECAELLRALGFRGARRGRQYRGTDDSPDVVDAIPGVCIEVKRRETTAIHQWMREAVESAGHHVPVVMHRRSREPWLVTVRMVDLQRLAELAIESLAAGAGTRTTDDQA